MTMMIKDLFGILFGRFVRRRLRPTMTIQFLPYALKER